MQETQQFLTTKKQIFTFCWLNCECLQLFFIIILLFLLLPHSHFLFIVSILLFITIKVTKSFYWFHLIRSKGFLLLNQLFLRRLRHCRRLYVHFSSTIVCVFCVLIVGFLGFYFYYFVFANVHNTYTSYTIIQTIEWRWRRWRQPLLVYMYI